MLESLLDFQFEVLTCFLNDGHALPSRSRVNGAHAYIAAPYGIYKTADGYLAIAMAPVEKLATLLPLEALHNYSDPGDWFNKRDDIKSLLAEALAVKTTAEWLAILEPEDIWCADVYDYDDLVASESFKLLKMEQWVVSNGLTVKTTRCPARVNGAVLTYEKGAPYLGEHSEKIMREFDL